MPVNQKVCANAPSPKLLTTPQLAHQLNVSESFLEKRRSMKLAPPYLKIGGRVFYRQEDIDAWLDEQTRKPKGGDDE